MKTILSLLLVLSACVSTAMDQLGTDNPLHETGVYLANTPERLLGRQVMIYPNQLEGYSQVKKQAVQ